ncbi:uncharacterized protein ACIB01_014177 [Guaruba guarouba]
MLPHVSDSVPAAAPGAGAAAGGGTEPRHSHRCFLGFLHLLYEEIRLVLELEEAGLSTNLVQNLLKIPQLMKLRKVQLWQSVSSLGFWQWWKHGEAQTSPISSGSHRELLSRKQRSAEPRALGVNRLGAVLMARAGCASRLMWLTGLE